MLKRFPVEKKQVQSKLVHKMAVFRKFKGININCGHRDTREALPYPETRYVTYFA